MCVWICCFNLLCLVFEMRSYYVAQDAHELCILLPQPPTCWGYRRVPPHSSLNMPLIKHYRRCYVFECFLQICGWAFHSLWQCLLENKSFQCWRQSLWPPFQSVSLWILCDRSPAPTSLWAPPRQRPLFPMLVFLALKQYLARRRHWSYSSYGEIIAPGYYGKGICTQGLNLLAWAI